MHPTPLCDHCRKICFPALKAPSATEIEDFLDGKKTGRILASPGDTVALQKIELRTLQTIKWDSSKCELCLIFHNIIGRHGAKFEFSGSLDDETISCRANPDMAHYGRVRDRKKIEKDLITSFYGE
jgi:hypothetical protein